MQKIISGLLCIILLGIGIYGLVYIPSVMDFSNVIIRLENNDTIYRFLIYIPLIISIFNGLISLANVFSKNMALTIMNIVISLGIVIYILLNVMGSVRAVSSIGTMLNYVMYANILCVILAIIDFVLYFTNKKKLNK